MALAVVIAGFAIGAALSIFAILQGRKTAKNDMGKGNEFKPTMANEGSTCQLVYGRVRVQGNIIWYGNLTSEEIETEQASAGKGMGMGQSSSGEKSYRYYCDMWIAVCIGKATKVKTYVNDKEGDVEAETETWNDGTQSYYPGGIENASKLKGVAHVFYERLYLGDNTTQAPTIHYVVDRVLTTPLTYQNMTSGNNPAAIIYDMLLQGGSQTTEIDQTLFQSAANFWNSKGYGLNLVIDQQTKVNEVINQVLSQVQGVFYITADNKYALKAIDPLASYDYEITQDEMKEFSFNRKAWTQIPNDFRATFISESDNFTERVVIADNPASIRLTGLKQAQTVDLKGFRTSSAASKRIWEIMKRESYPAANVKFKTTLKYAQAIPGQIFRIYHEDYGLDGADFRVTDIAYNPISNNEIEITGEQCVETLHDDNFSESGKTDWTEPDKELVAPTYAEILELPYSDQYGEEANWLFLIERKKYFEAGFGVIISQTVGGDYIRIGEGLTFSQRIRLKTAYSADTKAIDDTIGIEISLPSGHLDINLDSLSRSNLFVTPRFLIVDNEFMAFQTVTPITGGYKLLGIYRGALGTTQASHLIDTYGWITYIKKNVFSVAFSDFYGKMLFKNYPDEINPSLVTAIHCTYSAKAKQPRNVGRIEATRTGSSIAIQLWPSTSSIIGAGDEPTTVTDKEPPFDFLGDFEISYDTTTEIKTLDTFIITRSGAFTLTIKSRIGGFKSSGKSITIGASDGSYYA